MLQKNNITVEKLKELLLYDRDTGIFTNKITRSPSSIKGCESGYLCRGYIVIKIYGKNYLAHRLAWLYTFGYFPEKYLDHINLIKSDNRISNLREANQSQNQGNTLKHKRNTSGYKGVCFDKWSNRWKAEICFNGKSKNLGRFNTPEEAHQAYSEEHRKLYCEFSRTK